MPRTPRFCRVFAVTLVWAIGCGSAEPEPADVQAEHSALSTSASFLVSFTNGTIPSNADALVAGAGGIVLAHYAAVGALLARAHSAAFATALRSVAGVDAVGAVSAAHSGIGIVKRSATPRARRPVGPPTSGDPLAFRQWDMDQIRAPQAHAFSMGRKSVLVGVFDSGVDVTHPDLAGQVNQGASVSCVGGVPNTDSAVWANDVIGHGTHVSGIIAAAKNGVGVVGVAPGVRLAAVKVAVDDFADPNFGLVFADALVCAIDWAITHDFDLMNASLALDPFTAPIDDIFCSDQPDRAAIVQIVRSAVQRAARQRIPLVAASGNFFLDLAALKGAAPGSTCRVLPVQLPRVIGVSSVGFGRQLAFYSDYGFRAIDLTAPGGDAFISDPLVTDRASSGQVLSSVPPNSLYYQLAAEWDGQVQDCSSGACSTYAYLQGTSQAAPHVTGVAALVLSRFGRLSPEVLLAVLSLTAQPLPCPAGPFDPAMTGMPATCKGPPLYNNFYGAGEVDALAVAR